MVRGSIPAKARRRNGFTRVAGTFLDVTAPHWPNQPPNDLQLKQRAGPPTIKLRLDCLHLGRGAAIRRSWRREALLDSPTTNCPPPE